MDTLEPPHLQNTLEVGDDTRDALGALGLQNTPAISACLS